MDFTDDQIDTFCDALLSSSYANLAAVIDGASQAEIIRRRRVATREALHLLTLPATPDADDAAGEPHMWTPDDPCSCGSPTTCPATPDADDASNHPPSPSCSQRSCGQDPADAIEPLTEAEGNDLTREIIRLGYVEGGDSSMIRLVERIKAAAATKARADAWDVGYQRGLRDAEQDVQHGADNPYREQA